MSRGRRPWGMPIFDSEKIRVLRSKLSSAFKELRTLGFVARQNFMCCQGCAGYDIATHVGTFSKEKLAKFKGCVFYHHQDNTGLNRCGSLYLAYGGVTHDGKEYGLPNVECGKIIVEVLNRYSIETEWNGDGDTRILVKA